jgi:hypothetical protein
MLARVQATLSFRKNSPHPEAKRRAPNRVAIVGRHALLAKPHRAGCGGNVAEGIQAPKSERGLNHC